MSLKRKAAAIVPDPGDNDPKRKKLSAINQDKTEAATKAGLEFIAQLKQARDKRGRLISLSFLALPNKSEIPQYYQEIELPLAIDNLEDKLKRHGYPTLSSLESDLKRMVGNAKAFNERNSEVFADAEKIRKMVSNWMTKHNPAYKDGSGYTPFATPLPSELGVRASPKPVVKQGNTGGVSETEDAPEKPRRSVTLHGPSLSSSSNHRRASSTPAVQEAEDAGESFDGNTFQQAQEKLMSEMIQLKNDEGQIISGPFQNLPSRELRDYYRLIKHPVCLKGAQKLVRGIKGRDKPTGVSLFKSWQAFEEEIGQIWDNAREYNEDGSEIFELANTFESYFTNRLAEARKSVSEPAQPKVKLKMPAKTPEPQPKITIRFGQKTGEGANGVSVDSEALKRQQDLVKAGANGQSAANGNQTNARPSPRNPFGGSQSSSGPLPNLGQDGRSISAISPPVVNGVKAEVQPGQSPALTAVQTVRDSHGPNGVLLSPHLVAPNMPPPSSVTPRLASGSPRPQTQTNVPQHHAPPQIQHQTNPLDTRWRQPGKDASDALISNLHIATHPALKVERSFHLDIPASPTACQQTVTINLPASHYCIQIIPTISPILAYRQSKLIAMCNGSRMQPIVTKSGEPDSKKPVYETRVGTGVNRIEVEMIAGPPRGAPKVGPGQDIDFEKITLFVNALR